MQRLVLFSDYSNNPNIDQILDNLFPENFSYNKFAFIPANGLTKCKEEFIQYWREVAEQKKVKFYVVDIGEEAKYPTIERQKILNADIIVISGGDTIELARLLKKSKMLANLRKFVKKKNYVLGGYSAGAIIMTPNLNVLKILHENDEEMLTRLELYSGLSFIDFEIFPHYSPSAYQEKLDSYRKKTNNVVKPLPDSEFIIIDKSLE